MRIFTVIMLFGLWLVLSASHNFVHLALGALVAAIVVWLNPKSKTSAKKLSWGSAIAYIPWLFVRILKSGLHVCRLILQADLPIKPELIEHKTDLTSDGELAVLGNSITLTPGTITIEVKPGKLVVHAIDGYSQQELTSGVFDARVRQLFTANESSKEIGQ